MRQPQLQFSMEKNEKLNRKMNGDNLLNPYTYICTRQTCHNDKCQNGAQIFFVIFTYAMCSCARNIGIK